jgi:hypothetical protein
MLRHTVLFTWADGTSDGDVTELTGMLEQLPGQIAEIRAYTFGPDLGLAPGNADFGIVADFDDAAAFATYVAHADHQPVLAFVKAHAAQRIAVQLTI